MILPEMNRRQWFLASGAAWLGIEAAGRALGRVQASAKKVLFFTKSSGFQHSVITRHGGELGHAERILTDIGKEHGFEVVASKDGRLLEPDNIGQWDAFVFETTGDLTTPGREDKSPPISEDGEKALYDAIRNGKGFLAVHCGADTFGHHGKRNKGAADPYIQMLGGEFVSHGPQQVVTIEVVDSKFPGMDKGFGTSGPTFTINDEWYALKNMPEDLHVIMVQRTEGMKSGGAREYDRPNYPMTWARNFGKGRVFYTSMGHREDVWDNPMYQGLLLGALAWATGQVDADIEPNIKKVTPDYDKLHR
ncbi:MAG: ThuA domain-containing protein [Isosphaeraceae bacterium]